MSGYILAIDQGTTSTRAIVFDGAMKVVGVGPEGIHPALSGIRLGRARSRRRSGQSVVCDLQGGAEDGRARGRRHRRDRHHQPARDRRHLGQGDRQADPQRHRLAGPPHRAALRKAEEARAGEEIHAKDRAAARSLFLRHQDRLAARQCEGRAQARRDGRAAGRHHRQLPDLAADRRQGARHRRDQRLAHAGLQHREEPTGTPSCSRSSTSRPRCCRR